MFKKESKPLIFANKKFTFGKTLPLDFDKFQYTKLLKQYGATITTLLSSSTTHYVTDEWEKICNKCCGFVVHSSFLIDCIQQEILLEEADYLISPKEEIKELRRSFLEYSQSSFFDDEEIQAEEDVEPAPAHKLTLSQLREQQRLEREREKKEKIEKRERELQEKKEMREREIKEKKEIREREIKEKKLERELEKQRMMEAMQEAPPVQFEFGSSFELFDHHSSPLDELLLNNLEEEYRAKISEREQQRINKQLEKEKKQKELADKKLRKKNQIKSNIVANAQFGKKLGKEIKQAKSNDYNLKKIELAAMRKLVQEQWIAEQQKRREEWERKKIERKQEKKEKKQRWAQLKDQILLTEANEKGKKLFFGKIEFRDIHDHAKGNVIQEEYLINKRKECLMNIFKSFGTITETKENYEKGFIFVVYSTEEEAENAANSLAIYKSRKQLCNDQKLQLSASGNDSIAAPLPTFYTRWPKNQGRKIEIPPSVPPVPREEKQTAKPAKQNQMERGGRGGRGGRGTSTRGQLPFENRREVPPQRGGRGRGGSERVRGSGRGGRGRVAQPIVPQ